MQSTGNSMYRMENTNFREWLTLGMVGEGALGSGTLGASTEFVTF